MGAYFPIAAVRKGLARRLKKSCPVLKHSRNESFLVIVCRWLLGTPTGLSFMVLSVSKVVP